MISNVAILAFLVIRLVVPGKFDLNVVQQPQGKYSYVDQAMATQFQSATSYGSLGILAHSRAAGKYFSSLQLGDVITVQFDDGRTQLFRVSEIRLYQAAQPQSVQSYFIDLSDGSGHSAADVFSETFGRPGQLVLQTCIERDGQAAWGRLFVLAVPLVVDAHRVGPR